MLGGSGYAGAEGHAPALPVAVGLVGGHGRAFTPVAEPETITFRVTGLVLADGRELEITDGEITAQVRSTTGV